MIYGYLQFLSFLLTVFCLHSVKFGKYSFMISSIKLLKKDLFIRKIEIEKKRQKKKPPKQKQTLFICWFISLAVAMGGSGLGRNQVPGIAFGSPTWVAPRHVGRLLLLLQVC